MYFYLHIAQAVVMLKNYQPTGENEEITPSHHDLSCWPVQRWLNEEYIVSVSYIPHRTRNNTGHQRDTLKTPTYLTKDYWKAWICTLSTFQSIKYVITLNNYVETISEEEDISLKMAENVFS